MYWVLSHQIDQSAKLEFRNMIQLDWITFDVSNT